MNEDIEAVNASLALGREVMDHSQEVLQSPPEAIPTVLRQHFALQLKTVEACHAAAAIEVTRANGKIIGEVWLSRLRNECEKLPLERAREFAATATEDLDSFSHLADSMPPGTLSWQRAYAPFNVLIKELAQRQLDQSQEIMMEGFSRAAANTAGASVRITEDINGSIVRDEMVYGPEHGNEQNMGVGTMRGEVMEVLGSDQSRAGAHTERINLKYQQQLPRLYKELDARPLFSDALYAIARRSLRIAQSDNVVALAISELPSTMTGLQAGHLSALRSAILSSNAEILTQGATASRARQGDRQAASRLRSLSITMDCISRATAYHLPLEAITTFTPATVNPTPLPPDVPLFVFHDSPYELGGGVQVIAWLMHTDPAGIIEPAGCAFVVDTPSSAGATLMLGVASFEEGSGSAASAKVRSAVQNLTWSPAEPLAIRNKVGSRKWHRAIAANQESILEDGSLANVQLPTPR